MPTMMVNLTPHAVRVYGEIAGPLDEPLRVIEPSGTIARVATTESHCADAGGIQYCDVEYLEVAGLPEPQQHTVYIVSLLVALAAGRTRRDLIAPYKEVRNSEGTVIGCRGFQRVTA